MSEMQVIKKVVLDPTELHRWFPPDLRSGFIFLPGVFHLSVGTELCIWLQLPHYHADLYMVGLVAFRRGPNARTAKPMPPGCGVGLKPGQVEEMRFLRRLLMGDVEPLPLRTHSRTRLLTPWNCNIIIPHLQELREAFVMDLSPGGARVEVDARPVDLGREVQIHFPWYSGQTHSMELAWTSSHNDKLRMGLRRRGVDVYGEREWELLIQHAHRYFVSHVRRFTSIIPKTSRSLKDSARITGI